MPTLTDQCQGFLADIIAEPNDDAVRLIYADWLEDHGESERAEFIRVQCELARIGDWRSACIRGLCRDIAGYDDLTHALRRREGGLLDGVCGLGIEALPIVDGLTRSNCVGRGGYGWYRRGEPTPDGGMLEATFRRGFVAEITCRCEDWVGRACVVCGGTGQTGHAGVRFGPHDCPACHGTGRIGAHGPALVRACPLETVRLSGKRPNRFGQPGAGTPGPDLFQGEDTHFWITSAELTEAANRLPAVLRAHLGGYVRDCGPSPQYDAIGHYFSTEPDALTALSRILLAWARSWYDHAGRADCAT